MFCSIVLIKTLTGRTVQTFNNCRNVGLVLLLWESECKFTPKKVAALTSFRGVATYTQNTIEYKNMGRFYHSSITALMDS